MGTHRAEQAPAPGLAGLPRRARVTWPFTWDALGPADGDHNLSVKEVTEGSHGREVSVRARWVGHGIQLLGLNHQQVGHQCVHWGCSDSWERHWNSSPCRPFGVKHLLVSVPPRPSSSHCSDPCLQEGRCLTPGKGSLCEQVPSVSRPLPVPPVLLRTGRKRFFHKCFLGKTDKGIDEGKTGPSAPNNSCPPRTTPDRPRVPAQPPP